VVQGRSVQLFEGRHTLGPRVRNRIDTNLAIGDFIKHAHEFARFPLQFIRIRNKYPDRPHRKTFTWDDRGDSTTHPWVVPKKLWDPKVLTPSATYEEALEKFSQACINFIRKKAARRTKG